MKYSATKNALIMVSLLVLFFAPVTIAKNLTETGSYKVRLANTSNHLNCRTGPGTHFPVRIRLEHAEPIQVLHVTLHDKPWFYTNLRCFVRASSSFLEWQGEPKTDQDKSKPEVIR
jgi:hypothetical protein